MPQTRANDAANQNPWHDINDDFGISAIFLGTPGSNRASDQGTQNDY